MERMAEVVIGGDEQVLQHFLSNSPWDEQAVMDQVATETDALLGGSEESALYIDESAIKKQGKHSVGVARQWNGRLGKVDNSQVGVFAALGRGGRVNLIDARLYLPEEWTQDSTRCHAAKIPLPQQTFKTKIQLALEIVRRARALGLRYNWIGVDGFYGQAPELLRSLDAEGGVFMADIHSDQHLYLSDPAPYLPAAKGGRGRKPSRYHSDQKPMSVAEWTKQQPGGHWQRKTLRDTTKGRLVIEVLHQRVWLWDKKEAQGHCWHLVVRREVDSPRTIKYSLCNAAPGTSILKLAKMQAQRYWIERAFQDAKSHAGLAHYQARNWHAWHRHMALVMMAMLYMAEHREQLSNDFPLLSCYDIQVLLANTLPNAQGNEQIILLQMEHRHRKRQAAAESALRKQNRQRRKTVYVV
jgi:SRSO17 transposase